MYIVTKGFHEEPIGNFESIQQMIDTIVPIDGSIRIKSTGWRTGFIRKFNDPDQYGNKLTASYYENEEDDIPVYSLPPDAKKILKLLRSFNAEPDYEGYQGMNY